MKAFVFTFDFLLSSIFILYLLLFNLAVITPVNGFISDLSVFKTISDVLIVKNSYLSYSDVNYSSLIRGNFCFYDKGSCGEGKWVCGEWRNSSIEDGEIKFNREVLCVEGFS